MKIEGDRIIDPEITAEDQAQLATRYTERAVSFIERHKDRPFFLQHPDFAMSAHPIAYPSPCNPPPASPGPLIYRKSQIELPR